MEREQLQFNTNNGTINGIYVNAGDQSQLVVIANGHNGFYNYGMFPYIQQALHQSGISSIAFNYTHSGIIDDSDVFEDLEKYRKNCRRLEKEDLLAVLKHTTALSFQHHSSVFVLAHSMGGIATVFAAKEAEENRIPLNGLILLNALSTLNVRSQEVLEAWKTNKVWLIHNNRTHQDLPQGEEYLEETLASAGSGKWNPEPIVRSLKLPILVAHAPADESVPIWHGEALFEWSKANNPTTTFFSIPNASHTLNTKHPFEGTNPQLELFLEEVVRWVKG